MGTQPLARPFGAGFKPIRRSIFVSYHHGRDRSYYDAFSRLFAESYQVIQDNSVERKIDSNDAEYVIRKIREDYITGSSCTVVLCGAETPRRKFVDWEIKATLGVCRNNRAMNEESITYRHLRPSNLLILRRPIYFSDRLLDKKHGLIGINLPTNPLQANGKFIVASRLHDNIQSGYAIFTRWEQLSVNHSLLLTLIQQANLRSKALIRNQRELRSRNG